MIVYIALIVTFVSYSPVNVMSVGFELFRAFRVIVVNESKNNRQNSIFIHFICECDTKTNEVFRSFSPLISLRAQVMLKNQFRSLSFTIQNHWEFDQKSTGISLDLLLT